MNALDLVNISINFGGIQAVSNVTIHAEEHSITSIIGPNGAGKTTLFNIISGIYTPSEGSVYLFEKDITGKKQYEISRLGIARTFQNVRLFNELTVLQNVISVLDARANYGIVESLFGLKKKHKIDAANELIAKSYLNQLDLEVYQDEMPGNLPYGHQRRLELARALATEPKILLLDEPAAGLNPAEVEDFINLIFKIKEQYKLTVILIEHRLKVVYKLSKVVYVLDFGKLIAQGSPEEIRNNELVIKAYMGEEEK